MNNMSMRVILLSSFSLMIIALIVVSGLGYVSMNKSADAIVQTERSEALMEKIILVEKHVLKSMNYANIYVNTKNSSDLSLYSKESDKTLQIYTPAVKSPLSNFLIIREIADLDNPR